MTQSFRQAFRETYRPGQSGADLRGGRFDGESRRVLGEGAWRVGCPGGRARVTFERRAAGRWREEPHRAVPPTVFSEGMREADLFLRLAPAAEDDPFGAPSATAEIRGDVLRRILPGTRIAAAARSTGGSSSSAAGCAPTASTSAPAAC
ncbi:hypothetical protein ACFQY7_21540 [Actinomadura luteofluorescens]|uniref:hypothetical protein n=1 Tax=Actinomadura luteofluorescens TaxID=46163 RepID=UPI003643F63C